MFLILNIFEGTDDFELSTCLESNGRCKRVHRGTEYRNNYDIHSMNLKYAVVFDIVKNNAEFWNKQISVVSIINIPCRPDIIWSYYKEKYKDYASSAYFNRLKRIYEISKYKNCLTIPYEVFYEKIDCVKNFIGIGKDFVFKKPNFERQNFSLNWKYESEIKKMKKQVSWFENSN